MYKIRAPPCSPFIKMEEKKVKNEEIESQAEVCISKSGIKQYYIIFYDVLNKIQKIKVSKLVFLQFLGTHKIKIINNIKHYYIIYGNDYLIELSYKEYKDFLSFKSEEIKINNINSRYIEQSELTESTLHKRTLYKQEGIENLLYKNDIIDEIHIVIKSLNKTQQRRLIMYYFDNMTYEQIAKIEHCTKSAVKFSIDIAKEHLRNKLKYLIF